MKVEQLYEEEQGTVEVIDERPEIKKLRDEFIAALPQVLLLTCRYQWVETDRPSTQERSERSRQRFRREG